LSTRLSKPSAWTPINAPSRSDGKKSARGEYDEAVASYDKTVIGAYQETADAVVTARMIDQRLIDLRAAVAASEAAYGVAQGRYRAGLSNYLDVLAVEDRLLDARLALAGLEGAARSADVALIRALGGGYRHEFDKDRPHG